MAWSREVSLTVCRVSNVVEDRGQHVKLAGEVLGACERKGEISCLTEHRMDG